jgi:hypothetical protein
MRLTVYNGSPRGKKSNSKVLLDHFLKGFCEADENSYEIFYLNQEDDIENQCKCFQQAENVIVAFPLYIDCMPAQVKAFFEALADITHRTNLPVGFLIQSGFPESNQSIYLERYLKKLIRRMDCFYLGSAIRGAGEGIRIPGTARSPVHKFLINFGKITNIFGVGYFLNNKRTFRLYYKLGLYFGKNGQFDQDVLSTLQKPKKISWAGFLLYRLIGDKIYFNTLLRNNNAFRMRFNQSYLVHPSVKNQL